MRQFGNLLQQHNEHMECVEARLVKWEQRQQLNCNPRSSREWQSKDYYRRVYEETKESYIEAINGGT